MLLIKRTAGLPQNDHLSIPNNTFPPLTEHEKLKKYIGHTDYLVSIVPDLEHMSLGLLLHLTSQLDVLGFLVHRQLQLVELPHPLTSLLCCGCVYIYMYAHVSPS